MELWTKLQNQRNSTLALPDPNIRTSISRSVHNSVGFSKLRLSKKTQSTKNIPKDKQLTSSIKFRTELSTELETEWNTTLALPGPNIRTSISASVHSSVQYSISQLCYTQVSANSTELPTDHNFHVRMFDTEKSKGAPNYTRQFRSQFRWFSK